MRSIGNVPWISATIPKWKVTLESQDQRLVYIASDSAILLVSRDALKLPKQLSPQAIQAVRRSAALYWSPQFEQSPSGVRPEQILIQKAEPITWKDTCLEVPNPGEDCKKQPTQGWRIVLVGGKQALNPAQFGNQPTPTLTLRINATGQQVKPDITESAAKLAFATASEWGLPKQQGRLIGAEVTHWASGCEGSTFPYPCDPIASKGWLVKIEHQQKRWVVRVDRDIINRADLIRREDLALDNSFDEKLAQRVKMLAASHLEVSAEQVLLKKVEADTFGACLGLPLPIEKCAPDPGQGYRITVEGKPGQTQTYRISYRSGIRTEASKEFPMRTDNLSNRLASIVLKDARSRLKREVSQLHISSVEAMTECFHAPTYPPNAPCLTHVSRDKRRVVVTDFSKQVVYEIDGTGTILSVSS
jgi:hypothetical protein